MSNLALAGKPRKRFTPGEYLTLEREASEKSEYYDGEIYGMAGGAESHNAIAMNISGLLWSLLRKHGCQTYGSDMRVGVTPLGPFFYPGVSVACGERKFLDGRRDVLLNPIVAVEVLSKSTQRFDREIKLTEYRRVPSVEAILLVSSGRASVELHARQQPARSRPALWKHHTVAGLGHSIELTLSPSTCTLPLADIYEGVSMFKIGDGNKLSKPAAPKKRQPPRP